jgi:uncharacterized protein (TIGR02266 family)
MGVDGRRGRSGYQTRRPTPRFVMRRRATRFLHLIEPLRMLPAFTPDETGTSKRRRGVERRQGKRLPIEIDVAIEGAAHQINAQTADLSEGGLFVLTDAPIPIGTHVMMSFKLPNGAALSVLGVVKWTRERHDDSRPPGLGVAFFCLEPEARGTLERFCAVRHALY